MQYREPVSYTEPVEDRPSQDFQVAVDMYMDGLLSGAGFLDAVTSEILHARENAETQLIEEGRS